MADCFKGLYKGPVSRGPICHGEALTNLDWISTFLTRKPPVLKAYLMCYFSKKNAGMTFVIDDIWGHGSIPHANVQ